LKSNNQATFSEIQQNGDSLFLNDESVDYILCRNNLYLFNDLNKITLEFRRVLKPKGQVIFLQQLLEQDDLSRKDLKILKDYPLPNEKNLVSYFENRGSSI
jgi:ubiquinone/menaquinone biosynthesis C-methylase UbiE